MTIQHAILGFLNWQPLTGYDLKKFFAESEFLYWSGNNNQIYRSLVELHRQGLVTSEIEQPETGPSRKVYTITGAGRAELRQWLRARPELPQLRNPFLVQLAWADLLEAGELDELLAHYEERVQARMLMSQEQKRRNAMNPARTPREDYLWDAIMDNQIGFYEHELAWTRRVREALAASS